ncbi:MAG TPA: hypothetical protein VFV99_02200 [Kofleriaceae bacterium]|nr:hypothetical protein [Kofleriaceae bacterium]
MSACADATPAPAPDSAVPVPIDPTGRYAVTSSFALSSPPAAAADVLGELLAATDGPDDPSRYLIDLMIERLPPGTTKAYAAALAPYVAAYVNQRLAMVAPHFVDGARALSTGLARIATRFGTTETFDIASDGPRVEGDDYVAESHTLTRTITGVRFDLHGGRDVADVRFAPLGLPDITTGSVAMIDGDRLTIVLHATSLPYTRMLRLGIDFAVIPDVVPAAHDLAQALAVLVDCDQLGAAVAEYMGIGSTSFYATACTLGLTALASRIYARIDAIDAASLSLEVAGDAVAVDKTGDGPMDAFMHGTWTGSFASMAVTSSFEGTRQ